MTVMFKKQFLACKTGKQGGTYKVYLHHTSLPIVTKTPTIHKVEFISTSHFDEPQSQKLI